MEFIPELSLFTVVNINFNVPLVKGKYLFCILMNLLEMLKFNFIFQILYSMCLWPYFYSFIN